MPVRAGISSWQGIATDEELEMAIRKLGAGTVTGIEGLPPRTAEREEPWDETDDAALAAENDQADD